jgi:hypothetical protein
MTAKPITKNQKSKNLKPQTSKLKAQSLKLKA